MQPVTEWNPDGGNMPTPNVDDVRTDAKGRPAIMHLSDREILEEQLAILRATQDLVEQFFSDFSSGKMGGMMGTLGKMMSR